MNLAIPKYKERQTVAQSFDKTRDTVKKSYILFICYFFFMFSECVVLFKGSWKSNQAITYEHIQFYANYPPPTFVLGRN